MKTAQIFIDGVFKPVIDGVLGINLNHNCQGVVKNGGEKFLSLIVLPISGIQKLIPLSSLSAIITGTLGYI